MGIAINYNFAFQGSKAKLWEKLNKVRNEITKLDVEYVGDVIEIPSVKFSGGISETDSLGFYLGYFMQTNPSIYGLSDEDNQFFKERLAIEGNGVGLCVKVSEGCEPFSVILGRIGDSLSWFGGGFTKTMGAGDFIEAHETVISMLKICQKFSILESVYDEAGLWERMEEDE